MYLRGRRWKSFQKIFTPTLSFSSCIPLFQKPPLNERRRKNQFLSQMAFGVADMVTLLYKHIFFRRSVRNFPRILASSKAANPRVWNMAIFLNKIHYFDQEPFVWETLLTWKGDFYITNIAKYLSNKHRMAYWKSGIPYI